MLDRIWLGMILALGYSGCVRQAVRPDVLSEDATLADNGSIDSEIGATPHETSGFDENSAPGALFVATRGCAMCHQSDDPADGVLSGATLPVPGTMAYGPNLTPDPGTGLGAWSDDAIVHAMREGVDDEGQQLCAMPVFADMSDDEAAAIVGYLRSIPAVRRTVPPTECGGSDDVEPDDELDGTTDDIASVQGDGCTPALRINEVQTAGDNGASDEFVEIYNASDCASSLTGWAIDHTATTGTTQTRKWIGQDGDVIAGRGFVVIGGAAFTGSVLGRLAGTDGALGSSGGGIGLLDPNGNVSDSVGYGASASNPFVQQSPAPAPPSGVSIGRIPDGRDTNDNAADFVETTQPTPGAPNE